MRYISVIKLLSFAIVLALIGVVLKARADEVTLCEPHEEVYFSCPAGGRIISLCASGNISPDNGYVQYRFGRPGHVELQFPNGSYPPKNRFLISDISEGNIHFTHVKFKSGGYDYVIYQGFPSGLYIKRHRKLVENLTCEQGIYQQLSQRAYRGIRTTPPVDEIDN